MRWYRASRWLAPIIDQIPEVEREEFMRIGYTIGGMMVFPANRVDGKMTINGARGCHPRIKDRFDLTLECIRRHYLDEPSPLGDTLARYADFFGLFGDFAGYVDFFHLQDLVNEDTSTVKFFMPFEDFTRRRCRQPSTRTSGTANARLSSLNPAIGGSPLTSAPAADPLAQQLRPTRRAPGRTHSPATRGSSCVSVRWPIDR